MKTPRLSPRGSVLILVLIVCLGLVSVALVFGSSMFMAYRGTDNALAARQSDQIIESALRYAKYLMLNVETPGTLPLMENYQREMVPVGDGFFWLLGRSTADEPVDTQVYALRDEAGKLNLNAAAPFDAAALATGTGGMLQYLPNMTPEIAAAIMDWYDADETISSGGAESETYSRRQPAYGAKNRPFESTEELALVNGITMQVLYGEDTNRNGVLDPNENDGDKTLPDDNADGILDTGLLEHVTAWSSEPTLTLDGSARIFIRQTPQQPLAPTVASELGAVLGDDARGQQIVQPLGTTPINSVMQFCAYAMTNGMTEDELNMVYPYLTASDPAQFPATIGLINVNTASETVLACVPGLYDKAADLVAARAALGERPTNFAWIFTGSVLTPEEIQQAGPFLTAQSWQVSVDVAAVGRHGRGYRRSLFVLDCTGTAPRVVFRKNLAPLGWALGDKVRENLMAQEGNRR